MMGGRENGVGMFVRSVFPGTRVLSVSRPRGMELCLHVLTGCFCAPAFLHVELAGLNENTGGSRFLVSGGVGWKLWSDKGEEV